MLPLTSRAASAVVFRRGGDAITAGRFLADAAALAERLPERPFALNLCQDRYRFLVAFAAALLRGQTSLLTSDRAPERLRLLRTAHPDLYSLGEPVAAVAGIDHTDVPAAGSRAHAVAVPLIEGDHIAAIVFTSGTTGQPIAHPKPWAALVACSEAAAERFDLGGAETATWVGMVPPQHMYGFETTILLPLHADVASFAGATFFPEDVVQALASVPPPRALVTTPRQLRALLDSGRQVPSLRAVISATAPLPLELAARLEAAWGARVLEIFGATEVGSIASRRTVEGDLWRTYRTVELRRCEHEGAAVAVAHLPAPVTLADRVELADARSFRLLGRRADTIKLAGKRASLAGLNAALNAIDGVEDGAFFDPDDLDSNPGARLVAFVVAPERSPGEILADLRGRIEPPFLPRRIVKLAALPRNEVGKVPRAALAALQAAAPAAAPPNGAPIVSARR